MLLVDEGSRCLSSKDHLSQLQELSVVVSGKEGAVVWVKAPVGEGEHIRDFCFV